jgi:hypothetical protein
MAKPKVFIAGTDETSAGALPCHPPQRAWQTERYRPAPWARKPRGGWEARRRRETLHDWRT